MKDFNNIEADPIPEGLEFNESYMQDAFALYDAEKQKRKRRLLIWWITSALGFSAVLLIGIFFFTQEETISHSNKKQTPDKKIPAHRLAADSVPANAVHQHTGRAQNRNIQVVSGTDQNQAASSISASKSGYSMRLNTSKAILRVKSGSSFKKNRNINPFTDKPVSGRTDNGEQTTADLSSPNEIIAENTLRKQTGEIDQSIGSKPAAESIDLSSQPAVLAFVDDSAAKLPAYPTQTPLQAAENDTRKHHLFLNLGVNTLFGMNELKNKATFRESIGVSYNYQINPKLSIGAGLEYHSISRISYKRKIGDTTNSDKTTTILNKTTLNYISFLPQVHYHLWPNHTLNAGFGIEYLLVDPGERYETSNYTQETPRRTNSKLYYSTFNRYNFSISLGYTYQFSRFMAVHASYYYGFTDITRNTDFNKTFDRNSRLQIGLKIKLY